MQLVTQIPLLLGEQNVCATPEFKSSQARQKSKLDMKIARGLPRSKRTALE
jgi:hypothetical protein